MKIHLHLATALLLAPLAQLAVCQPAMAQTYIDEEAFGELSEQGVAAWEGAQAAAQRNDLAGACAQFTRAARLWAQAAPDAPADFVSANLNDTSAAREAANDYCQAANGSTPFARTDARGDAALQGEMDDLRKGNTWAVGEYQQATRRYESGDKVGACSSGKSAATELARIAAAMRANPALEGAFANPAMIYQNASDAASVRDETFCAGVGG